MAIVSDKGFVSGQPSIEGHRLWVSHIVGNINELGLEEFIDQFELGDDPEIRNKIREAFNYCKNEKCDEDNKNRKLVAFCQNCSKCDSYSGPDMWKIAQKLHENYFSV